MPISSDFTTSIQVQTVTQVFGGGQSYSTAGTCLGYIRRLNAREQSVAAQAQPIVTHRAVMDRTRLAAHGEYLFDGTTRYRVLNPNPHTLSNRRSGMAFQIVDCEVVV